MSDGFPEMREVVLRRCFAVLRQGRCRGAMTGYWLANPPSAPRRPLPFIGTHYCKSSGPGTLFSVGAADDVFVGSRNHCLV